MRSSCSVYCFLRCSGYLFSFRPESVDNFTVGILRETGVNVTCLLGTVDMARDEYLSIFEQEKGLGNVDVILKLIQSIWCIQNWTFHSPK